MKLDRYFLKLKVEKARIRHRNLVQMSIRSFQKLKVFTNPSVVRQSLLYAKGLNLFINQFMGTFIPLFNRGFFQKTQIRNIFCFGIHFAPGVFRSQNLLGSNLGYFVASRWCSNNWSCLLSFNIWRLCLSWVNTYSVLPVCSYFLEK